MKKFVTLLSAAFIAVASLATVASAAPITEDSFKPTVALDVTRVVSGRAIVTATVEVDKELDFANTSGDDSFWMATGYGMTGWQIDLALDGEIFADATKVIAKDAQGEFSNIKASSNGVVTIGTATLTLNEAYKSMTVEELNKLDFADVTYAEFIIGSWNEAFEYGERLTNTTYRSDDAGDYVIDLSATRIGTYVDEPVTPPTPPAPTASVAITAAKKTTDANWVAEYGNTMFWGVDFANAGFNGEALVKIFSADKERELIVKTPADAEINGEASFGVFVIVGDSEDALGLTVTSGDVTATAAPVAYADAE